MKQYWYSSIHILIIIIMRASDYTSNVLLLKLLYAITRSTRYFTGILYLSWGIPTFS